MKAVPRSGVAVLVAVLFFALRLPSQESRGAGQHDRERVRDAVVREDWKAAYAICAEALRETHRPDRQWWMSLAGACYVPDGAREKAPSMMLRAWAFEMVGEHGGALERYRRALGEAKTEHDTARTFISIARCAVWLEDFPECLAALEGVERNATGWILDDARRDRNFVAAIARAPRDVDARLQFASGYWVLAYPANDLRDPCAAVTAFLARTLDHGPSPDQSRRILWTIFDWNHRTGRPGEAVRWARRLDAEHSGSVAAHQAAVALAKHDVEAKAFDGAERWARQVVLAKHETSWTASAYLVLAEVDESRGLREAMGKNLERAVDTCRRAAADTHPADDALQKALVRLGHWHRDAGDFDRALECFRKWPGPSSTCGLGHIQARDARVLVMAETLVMAGRHEEALKDWIDPMLVDDVGCCRFGGNPSIARLAVTIHERRGTLDQLVKQCQEIPAHEQTYTSDVALELARIRLGAQKPDAKVLVADLLSARSGSSVDTNPQGSGWRGRAICDVLRLIPGPALQELREHHADLMRTPPRHDDDVARSRVRWLYGAAILVDTPESKAWIASLEAEAREAQPTPRRRTEHDDVLIAVDSFKKTE